MDGGRLYQVLGIDSDASADDIKKAFRGIARKYHPDVAGDDAEAAEKFKAAREAYEVLSEPGRRAAYDIAIEREAKGRSRPRQGRATQQDKGAFFRAFYKRASGGAGDPRAGRTKTHGERFSARVASGGAGGGNEASLDPEDIFADFGFGAGAGGAKRYRTSRHEPQRGNDVAIKLTVPATTARDGGIITAHYARLSRSAGWKKGSDDPGVERCHDPVELDVPAGTLENSVRRYRGLGDAGAWGGAAGDLVVHFRIVSDGQAPRSSASTRGPTARNTPPTTPESGNQVVEISVSEALLGGRIEVQTPSGTVRVTLPPCTSSGKRLRLSGRGAGGSDLYLELRIVVPTSLDARSRALIEEFAELNPESPDR